MLVGMPLSAAAVWSGFVDVWAPAPGLTPTVYVDYPVPPRSEEEHDKIYPKAFPLHKLEIDGKPGNLIFLGTSHTKDPESKQVKAIKEEFTTNKPDVAFLEGRLGLFAGTFDQGVRQFGESGAVYGMSRNLDVPVYTIEPTREVEAAYLTRKFSKRTVAFALFFRVYLGDRGDGALADSEALHLLNKRQKQYGLSGAIADLADAERVWKDELKEPGDWRKASREVFFPKANGTLLQQIANAANEVRDQHMVNCLVSEVRKGKKVFIAMGLSHLIRFEPVLKAILGR